MNEPVKIQAVSPGERQRRIEVLERQNAALEATVRALRAELEQVKRRQHRQAAP
ncbi:MAG: hypothetical protein ACR2HB_04080 [Dehalococcoidia bacterium]